MPQPATPDEIAQIRRLRIASFIEASTLLILLFIAVPLKHVLGYPLATRIMGPVHGAAFVAYGWSLLAALSGGGWSRREMWRLSIAAFVPLGGFFNGGLLRRKQAIIAAELARQA